MGDEPNVQRLTAGLGNSWEIAKNTYKPYPAGIVFHAVIDACLGLRTSIEHRIDQIALVTVQGSPLLLARGDRKVGNERDLRISIHHCVACALLIGAAGVEQFGQAAVFRPDLVGLRQKVKAELDTSLADGAARVTVRLTSGEVLGKTVMAPRGSLADPLSDHDIETKLRDCLRLCGSEWDGERLINAVWCLDALDDITALLKEEQTSPSATA